VAWPMRAMKPAGQAAALPLEKNGRVGYAETYEHMLIYSYGDTVTARRPLLAPTSASALAETFKVLGDVTRVRILDAISRSELCVCDIARLVGISESATSHQLRVLRGMRLVRPRRDGRQMFYALDDQHIVRLFEQGLEHVEERQSR
jgi:DNA-binding transcriptional ArsR family regulator